MKILKTYNELFESIVKKLDYSDQKLTKLPELPDTLEKLYCSNNKLTKLPELPESLKYLDCKNNNLPYNNLEDYWKWFHEYYPIHYPKKYKRYLAKKKSKKYNI